MKSHIFTALDMKDLKMLSVLTITLLSKLILRSSKGNVCCLCKLLLIIILTSMEVHWTWLRLLMKQEQLSSPMKAAQTQDSLPHPNLQTKRNYKKNQWTYLNIITNANWMIKYNMFYDINEIAFFCFWSLYTISYLTLNLHPNLTFV